MYETASHQTDAPPQALKLDSQHHPQYWLNTPILPMYVLRRQAQRHKTNLPQFGSHLLFLTGEQRGRA